MYILDGRKSIDIVQAVKENHFNEFHTFGTKQGMNVAVAVLDAFDSSASQTIDPTYGSIKFVSFGWGVDEDGRSSSFFEELSSHTCSPEELGLTGHDHKFWPINLQQDELIQTLNSNLLCLDQDVEISGTYFTTFGKSLVVDVVKCTDSDQIECKSDEEIKEYFQTRQMWILSN